MFFRLSNQRAKAAIQLERWFAAVLNGPARAKAECLAEARRLFPTLTSRDLDRAWRLTAENEAWRLPARPDARANRIAS